MTQASPLTVLDSLNLALHQAFVDDPQAVLLGEDVLDPYGGAFKVARGLSTAFPERVLTTPISEAGITGIAGGMALRGMHLVVEIMFGDFITLTADQVINHLTKFHDMYNGQVDVPVVIRTPMGGRRGYGPTHSQTLEKLFLGVPGLTVLAPFHIKGLNPLGAPGQLLYETITRLNSPAFFVENKLQYLLKLLTPEKLAEYDFIETTTSEKIGAPTYTLSLKDAPRPQLTLTAYGYMAYLALEALHTLAYEDEIFCDLVVPTQLAPFELGPLFQSVRKTGRLLTLEEGTLSLGWGSEVLARAAETLGPEMKRFGRIAARETVIPVSPDLEDEYLPGLPAILSAAREMVAV
jgi:pyruvate/2-oxoglutarate/acetoin dehydrogenase E1 component